jgi:Holliday junction resolvasome RuvABC endonuclease subunit
MKYLFLDCATVTGFAVIIDGKVIGSGSQSFAKRRGESNGAMFLRFRAWLKRFIAEQGRFDLIAYEQAHHRGGAATEICVNITGRVQEVAAELDIEYVCVETRVLKKSATGKANAGKEAVIEAMQKRGHQPEDDNEADALAGAYWMVEEYGS